MSLSKGLVAIDPGKHICGLAVFVDGVLTYAGEPASWHVTNTAVAVLLANGVDTEEWVAETPQNYPGQKAKEIDLESLREVLRRIEINGMVKLRRYKPRAWKGQVPKEIHHRRIRLALREPECRIVDALPRTRDAMDAVGLGLFVLGRTKAGGIK
jgi:hypothetical protein